MSGLHKLIYIFVAIYSYYKSVYQS